jgi:beta-lactamase superfamily II metal-dependent hydrolase
VDIAPWFLKGCLHITKLSHLCAHKAYTFYKADESRDENGLIFIGFNANGLCPLHHISASMLFIELNLILNKMKRATPHGVKRAANQYVRLIICIFFIVLMPDTIAQSLKVKADRTAILKEEPSGNGAIIKRIDPNTLVTKIGDAPRYYHIIHNLDTGWSYKGNFIDVDTSLIPRQAMKESLRARTDVLQIEVIDVEKGDATLIVCPEENGERDVILIDCAMGNDVNRIRESIASFGVDLNTQPVTVFVVSHYDSDHTGGIKEIVPLCQTIYDPGPAQQTLRYRSALKDRESDRDTMTLTYFEQFSGGVTMECVAVNNATDNEPFLAPAKDKNQNSVALIISFNGFDYFTAGDLTFQPERSLATSIRNCDVYHVNHHGSSTSSSDLSFVLQLDPEVSVVSNGTQYGHPNTEVGERLTNEVGSLFVQTNVNPAGNSYPNDPKYVADDTILTSRQENKEGATGSIRIIVDPIVDKYYVVMPGLDLTEATFPIEH